VLDKAGGVGGNSKVLKLKFRLNLCFISSSDKGTGGQHSFFSAVLRDILEFVVGLGITSGWSTTTCFDKEWLDGSNTVRGLEAHGDDKKW
jgi:hypothetical protein